jgi:hypothetical protein
MAPKPAPDCFVSVRISAAHHVPRRGQIAELGVPPVFETVKCEDHKNAIEMGQGGVSVYTPGPYSYDFHREFPRSRRMAGAVKMLGLCLLTALPAWGAPTLNGPYSGELGVVLLETEQGGRVSGHFEHGGQCAFDPERRVLEGQFEGGVLVGTVTLCQAGPACKERTYPLLAFFNPSDKSLSADIKLEADCTSPALKGKRLVLLPSSSAADAEPTQDAMVRKRLKHNGELAKRAFLSGQKALRTGDFQQAKSQFEIGLSFDERNFAGYLGLGVAEQNLGHTRRALEAFSRSAELKPDHPDPYFNIACAYARLGDKKEALSNLDRAVKYGFDEPDLMSGDHDLGKVLSDDPEFRALIAKARDQGARHQAGGRRGEGQR